MRPVAWAALLITVSSWFRKLPKVRRRDVEEVLLSLELFASDKAEMPFLSEGAEELRLPFVTEVKLDAAEVLSPFVTDLLFDVEEVLLSLELFASDKAEMPFLSEGAEELRLPFVTDGAEALSPFVTDLLPELSLRWRTLRPRLRARPRLGRR